MLAGSIHRSIGLGSHRKAASRRFSRLGGGGQFGRLLAGVEVRRSSQFYPLLWATKLTEWAAGACVRATGGQQIGRTAGEAERANIRTLAEQAQRTNVRASELFGENQTSPNFGLRSILANSRGLLTSIISRNKILPELTCKSSVRAIQIIIPANHKSKRRNLSHNT